jgi:hypothetical protein
VYMPWHVRLWDRAASRPCRALPGVAWRVWPPQQRVSDARDRPWQVQAPVEMADLVDPDGVNPQRLVDALNDLQAQVEIETGKARATIGHTKKLLDKHLSIVVDTQTLKTGGLPGPKGPQGRKGYPGYQGPVGAEGDRGPTGDVGPVGAKGYPGPQGLRGKTGDVGPEGNRGVKGLVGPQGFTGPPGPRGQLGTPGARGPRGVRGAAGYKGLRGAQVRLRSGSARKCICQRAQTPQTL